MNKETECLTVCIYCEKLLHKCICSSKIDKTKPYFEINEIGFTGKWKVGETINLTIDDNNETIPTADPEVDSEIGRPPA